MTETAKSKAWKNPPEDKTPIFIRSELDDYGLDVYEFRVLAHIARREGKIKGKESRGCFEKQKNIADCCKMSHRKAQQCLKTLCEAGLLTIEPRRGDSNIYRIAPSSNWKHPSELEAIRRKIIDTQSSTKKEIQ